MRNAVKPFVEVFGVLVTFNFKVCNLSHSYMLFTFFLCKVTWNIIEVSINMRKNKIWRERDGTNQWLHSCGQRKISQLSKTRWKPDFVLLSCTLERIAILSVRDLVRANFRSVMNHSFLFICSKGLQIANDLQQKLIIANYPLSATAPVFF